MTLLCAGKVVAGYRVKTSSNGLQHWDLLGKRDPLSPQMFYPIEKNITIGYGDILVSRLQLPLKLCCNNNWFLDSEQSTKYIDFFYIENIFFGRSL